MTFLKCRGSILKILLFWKISTGILRDNLFGQFGSLLALMKIQKVALSIPSFSQGSIRKADDHAGWSSWLDHSLATNDRFVCPESD